MMVFMRSLPVFLALSALHVAGCCGAPSTKKGRGDDDSAPPTTVRAAPSAASPLAPPKPALPPEPAPPVADRASDVPGMQAKLLADPAYAAVWTGPRADLNLFLTVVSQLFATASVPVDLNEKLTKKKLRDAASQLFLITARQTAFPEDFTNRMRAHLAATKGEAHLGVWSPVAKGSNPHNYTALAAWMNQEDPAYLRELIAAKGGGSSPFGTEADGGKPPSRPYLVDEAAALQRLSLIAPLTSAEETRVAELRAEASLVKVPIKALLSEYKDNEVRADLKFKDKIVQVPGVVNGTMKDAFGGVHVLIGSGGQFEVEVLDCAPAPGQLEAILALSKGDQVTVRGRVSGRILTHVGLKECSLVR